jgi:hypothetical protein
MKRNHPAASCEGKIRFTALFKAKKALSGPCPGGKKKEQVKEFTCSLLIYDCHEKTN